MQKIRLELLGITYNQIESGVYALILKEVGSNRRIPIIIGFPEAQAIECKLQDIKTPRPLTHDIMIQALSLYGINLSYVMIKRLPNGVFAADLHLNDGEKEVVIDSRSSDAVALAIRTNSPIYTSEEVLMEAGFDPEEIKRSRGKKLETNTSSVKPVKSRVSLENLSLEQLSDAMAKAAESENYEEAARIKAIIEQKQKDDTSASDYKQ